MFNVNIIQLLKDLLPIDLRRNHFIAFFGAIIRPVQRLHDRLSEYRLIKRYDMAINSQVIYLEKVLNDKFNSDAMYPSIYIDDNLDLDILVYMGNLDEEHVPEYMGNLYDDTVEYNTGDEIIYNNITYQCNTDGIDHAPPDVYPQFWDLPDGIEEPVVFIGNKDEYNLGNFFTVHIQIDHYNDITARLDEMYALLNKYKTFGVTYKIQTYEGV